MFSFLKHKVSAREKLLFHWGFVHFGLAIVVGFLLGWWLLGWQSQGEKGLLVEMKHEAVSAMSSDKGDVLVPKGSLIGGHFSLIGPEGQVVRDADYAGKYLLIYFGYTSCPDMCPTGLESMSRAMDALGGDGEKVQPLFITVDPARDTPQRLKEYDSAFHPRIIGLTGNAEQIASVAKQYQVYYEKGEGDQDYEVDHTSLIYLMNPEGKLIQTFSEEVDPKQIVASLKKAWGQQP